MCREDKLNYEWQESEAGPPRKYYMLTANGKKQLVVFHEYGKHLTAQIETLGRKP
jgi:PadR family transcriptional regulator PadR